MVEEQAELSVLRLQITLTLFGAPCGDEQELWCAGELWKQCHKDEGRDGVEKPLLVTSAWGTAGATVLILLVPLGNV